MIYITAFFVLSIFRLSASGPANVCSTAGCVKAAAEIKSKMDESVNPCDDIYAFTCGGWLKTHEIPEDKSSITVFSELQRKIDLQLKDLMARKLTGSEPSFIKKLKTFYDSCMNLDAIENIGDQPLTEVLQLLGGWPVVEGSKWDASKFSWLDMETKLRELGFGTSSLFHIGIAVDFKNNTIRMLVLDQGHSAMRRQYMMKGLSDPATSAYFQVMVKAAKLLGADESTAEAELRQVFDFETLLANMTVPFGKKRNMQTMYNKYTIKKVKEELAPNIPWLELFNNVIGEKVFEDDVILAIQPDYIKDFAKVLQTVDNRILANYLVWRAVFESLPLLSKKWHDLYNEYNFALTGKTQEEARWDQCLNIIQDSFLIALNSYYIREYFEEEGKAAAAEILNYIHKTFMDILDKIDWMDPTTKQNAKDKALAMKKYVGFPKELLDDAVMEKVYEKLSINNNQHFKNIMNLRKWATDVENSLLRTPYSTDNWKERANVAVINAFHGFIQNSIEIPAGVLQGVFFEKDRPNYLNFGAIGSVMGHEVTHGFDNRGKLYDKDGNMKNWWEKETDEKYQQKIKCVVDFYGKYSLGEGLPVNGERTLGENIGDMGGIKEAYLAYQTWVKEHGEEPQLPGLNYTPNQMLFINSAAMRCSKYRPESYPLVLDNPHSPPKFRALGSLSNYAEFAKEFNCPPGSPMNPEQKCEVW